MIVKICNLEATKSSVYEHSKKQWFYGGSDSFGGISFLSNNCVNRSRPIRIRLGNNVTKTDVKIVEIINWGKYVYGSFRFRMQNPSLDKHSSSFFTA